jgi:CRP/FNR family transcriptional regulator, cyclic AMP receptor protein
MAARTAGRGFCTRPGSFRVRPSNACGTRAFTRPSVFQRRVVSPLATVEGSDEERVAVLDLDPDLWATIPQEDQEFARTRLLASCVTVEPGSWDPMRVVDIDALGILVLDGLLTRNVEVAGTVSRELLGEGDIIRPWDDDSAVSPVPARASWTIIEPSRFAVLDRRFTLLGGRWPKLNTEVIHRVLRRSRWLAVRLAIGSLRGTPDRIMLLLWHLAGNWGRVTPEGTLIPFRLTHEAIAELIGARRPSVTSAISELRAAGKVKRTRNGWLLCGEPPSSSAK